MAAALAGPTDADAGGAPKAAMLVVQLPAAPARPAGAADGGVPILHAEGAQLCVIQPDGRKRFLVKDFHSTSDPSVPFDGKRVLFAGKRNQADIGGERRLSTHLATCAACSSHLRSRPEGCQTAGTFILRNWT